MAHRLSIRAATRVCKGVAFEDMIHQNSASAVDVDTSDRGIQTSLAPWLLLSSLTVSFKDDKKISETAFILQSGPAKRFALLSRSQCSRGIPQKVSLMSDPPQ